MVCTAVHEVSTHLLWNSAFRMFSNIMHPVVFVSWQKNFKKELKLLPSPSALWSRSRSGKEFYVESDWVKMYRL
jgi:hypothetical protein